jgi:hypothetical protein
MFPFCTEESVRIGGFRQWVARAREPETCRQNAPLVARSRPSLRFCGVATIFHSLPQAYRDRTWRRCDAPGAAREKQRGREMRCILYAMFAMVGLSSATPVFAASPGTCQEYAHSAVNDFKQGTAPSNAKKCKITPNARWQSNFQNHYNWCLTAPAAWLGSERKWGSSLARLSHLSQS